MARQNEDKFQNHLLKTRKENDGKKDITPGQLPQTNSPLNARLEEQETLPHRNFALHWATFALSLLSLILLSIWVFGSRGTVSTVWVLVDIGLGVVFAIEFLTRSGFRWHRFKYLRSHFFDFFAIVPALALVNHGFALEGIWVWFVLVARFVRLIDRFLGDGFVTHNLLALLEGIEEEITDRVLGRIVARVQADVDRASFSRGIAEALQRNKPAVLQRIKSATPQEGIVPSLARIVGLDTALERAEEKTFDAIVGIINSQEVDSTVRDIINTSLSRLQSELGDKSWRRHLGIRHLRARVKTAPNPPSHQNGF
jgi:hypothetical protein